MNNIPDRVSYLLLGTIILVTAPHIIHLSIWTSILCGILFAWRGLLIYRQKPVPSRYLLAPLTLACAASVLIEFHTLWGREAGIALLILLTCMKLLELRALRDAMVLMHLSCFISITNFLYSQGIVSGLYMLLVIICLITTWITLQTPTLAPNRALKLTRNMMLQALPLALILFVLFPRIQGPLWGMPNDAFSRTGLSDNMTIGSLNKLVLSNEVAFRVHFNNAPPQQSQMYWRGPVLWDFDGKTWQNSRFPTYQAKAFSVPSNKLETSYDITLEPQYNNFIFALDLPSYISHDTHVSADYELRSKRPIDQRIRYQATSQLNYLLAPNEYPEILHRGLRLPQGLNPKARELAQSWKQQLKQPEAIVNASLRYFNQNPFRYTLEPEKFGQYSVDEFLFTYQQGFCEHYASAFVFLMRAAGVPARVVTGYQGGEFNSVGDYYIIRQSDAHAWAEVWLADSGWVRYDPTAAIAPNRVERNLSQALADNSALPYIQRNPPAWLNSLRLNWDNLANQWNQWVLGYDTERQFALLSRIGMEDISWQKMVYSMLFLLGSIIVMIMLIMLRGLLFTPQPEPIQKAWLQLCRKLSKAGYPRSSHETAISYTERVSQLKPELNSELDKLAQIYNQLRYTKQHDELLKQQFIQLVKQFKIKK